VVSTATKNTANKILMERKTPFTSELGRYKRHELLTGEIRYPENGYSGYGNGGSTNLMDFISDEMREDWRKHRKELIEFWRAGEYMTDKPWLFVRCDPDTLPWAAEQFD